MTWQFPDNLSVFISSDFPPWSLFYHNMCTCVALNIKGLLLSTRDYPGLLRQSLKFRETASSHSEKCSFQAHIISFYVWDHISEGKACIKNPKACGPSKWPPLTTGMSYSCRPSVSIKKPRDKRLAYKLVDNERYDVTITIQEIPN